ncbi:MAG TPA: SelB C-terminal domain-containing protein, partial [Kofleriaceae bacterium]
TREHLQICELLRVRRGVIAVTKADLVDEEGQELARGEIREAVAGTFLATAPMIFVSTRDGRGLDDLRRELTTAVADLPERAPNTVFRLGVDRVFTKKGFGTIVTGTILGGAVAIGDEVTVIPSGFTARVRGLESHGEAIERAVAGQRCAINLGGLAVDEIFRGDMLVQPERVVGSHIMDVEVTMIGEHPAREKVLLHHATTQVSATLTSEGTFGQLRIDRATPVGALPGDHFILRGFERTDHGTTIGGGTIVRVLAPKTKHADRIAARAAAKLEQRIVQDVIDSRATGMTATQIVQRTGIADLAATLDHLVKLGEIAVDNTRYLDPKRVVVVAPVPAPALSPVDQQVLAKLNATGLEPPRIKDLPGAMGLDDRTVKAALDRLLKAKLIYRINAELMMHAEIVGTLREKLRAFLVANKTIDAQGWKTLTNASRKFTIPLAEFFDAEKLTLRIGDTRRLR